jgi:hypothetical protein
VAEQETARCPPAIGFSATAIGKYHPWPADRRRSRTTDGKDAIELKMNAKGFVNFRLWSRLKDDHYAPGRS